MKEILRKKLSDLAAVVEISLGVLILVACFVTSFGMVFTTSAQRLFYSSEYLQQRISDVCLILIGLELIKMITSYSTSSVVEVMLLAAARQMIVEHSAPLENLITVIAIGLLFAIRNYLSEPLIRRENNAKKENCCLAETNILCEASVINKRNSKKQNN